MTPQRREGSSWVQDLWHARDPDTGEKVPSKVYGKGSRWRGSIIVEGRPRTKAFARRVDADEWVKNVSASLVTGQYVHERAGDLLVRDVMERFIAGVDVKHSTLLAYKSAIKAQIVPRWGSVRVADVTPSAVRAWLVEMQRGDPDAETKRGRQGLSTGSARKTGRILSMALDAAVQDRLIRENPMRRVKLPRESEARHGMSLTREQLHALADAMPTSGDRTLTLTLGYTGLRWGEAVGLRVRSVDLDRRRVHVRRTYSEAGGSIREETPKSHEARWVPFPPFLAPLLREQVEGKSPADDVFTSSQGGPLRGTNWLPRVLRPALERAGVPDAEQRTIHDLRHTYSTLAIHAGGNVRQLQKALGHADATVTLNQYSDVFEDDYAELGDRMEPRA